MATIEDVNERTILQQFHSLYKKQTETETNVQKLDTKIDQETINRQTADLSINTKIQALKDQIDSLGVLFTYKGEVATIQDLPATDNKPGDVYYVDNEQSEYVWLEKSGVYQWEEFGPAIDLSQYAKQEDLQQLENAVNAMNTKVENNASSIVSLTNTKQNKLTAGTNITIDENNVISASGGESYTEYTNVTMSTIRSEIYTKKPKKFIIYCDSNKFTGTRSIAEINVSDGTISVDSETNYTLVGRAYLTFYLSRDEIGTAVSYYCSSGDYAKNNLILSFHDSFVFLKTYHSPDVNSTTVKIYGSTSKNIVNDRDTFDIKILN